MQKIFTSLLVVFVAFSSTSLASSRVTEDRARAILLRLAEARADLSRNPSRYYGPAQTEPLNDPCFFNQKDLCALVGWESKSAQRCRISDKMEALACCHRYSNSQYCWDGVIDAQAMKVFNDNALSYASLYGACDERYRAPTGLWSLFSGPNADTVDANFLSCIQNGFRANPSLPVLFSAPVE